MQAMIDKYTDLQAKYAEEQSTKREIKKELGKEDFLQLMVEQMKNQDPLNPMNNSEFIAQTAQFSSLEQLLNISGSVEKLSESIKKDEAGQNQLFSAANFIGKKVGFYSNTARLKNGEASISFEAEGMPAAAQIDIKNGSGQTIKSLDIKDVSMGKNSIVWDGTDAEGNKVDDGNYIFEVKAVNAEGDAIPTLGLSEGLVKGVSNGSNGMQFDLGGLKIASNQIYSVYENDE